MEFTNSLDRLYSLKYFATIHRVYFSKPLNTKISISSEYLIIQLDSKTFNSSFIHSSFCKVHITRIVRNL